MMSLRYVLRSIQEQLGALKRISSRFPFRLVAFRRSLPVQATVKMAESWNRKRAQPVTVFDLAGDQDNFLTFGVAGFCHGCLRVAQYAEELSSLSCA